MGRSSGRIARGTILPVEYLFMRTRLGELTDRFTATAGALLNPYFNPMRLPSADMRMTSSRRVSRVAFCFALITHPIAIF